MLKAKINTDTSNLNLHESKRSIKSTAINRNQSIEFAQTCGSQGVLDKLLVRGIYLYTLNMPESDRARYMHASLAP